MKLRFLLLLLVLLLAAALETAATARQQQQQQQQLQQQETGEEEEEEETAHLLMERVPGESCSDAMTSAQEYKRLLQHIDYHSGGRQGTRGGAAVCGGARYWLGPPWRVLESLSDEQEELRGRLVCRVAQRWCGRGSNETTTTTLEKFLGIQASRLLSELSSSSSSSYSFVQKAREQQRETMCAPVHSIEGMRQHAALELMLQQRQHDEHGATSRHWNALLLLRSVSQWLLALQRAGRFPDEWCHSSFVQKECLPHDAQQHERAVHVAQQMDRIDAMAAALRARRNNSEEDHEVTMRRRRSDLVSRIKQGLRDRAQRKHSSSSNQKNKKDKKESATEATRVVPPPTWEVDVGVELLRKPHLLRSLCVNFCLVNHEYIHVVARRGKENGDDTVEGEDEQAHDFDRDKVLDGILVEKIDHVASVPGRRTYRESSYDFLSIIGMPQYITYQTKTKKSDQTQDEKDESGGAPEGVGDGSGIVSSSSPTSQGKEREELWTERYLNSLNKIADSSFATFSVNASQVAVFLKYKLYETQCGGRNGSHTIRTPVALKEIANTAIQSKEQRQQHQQEERDYFRSNFIEPKKPPHQTRQQQMLQNSRCPNLHGVYQLQSALYSTGVVLPYSRTLSFQFLHAAADIKLLSAFHTQRRRSPLYCSYRRHYVRPAIEAAYDLGMRYRYGIGVGVRQDANLALRYLLAAARALLAWRRDQSGRSSCSSNNSSNMDEDEYDNPRRFDTSPTHDTTYYSHEARTTNSHTSPYTTLATDSEEIVLMQAIGLGTHGHGPDVVRAARLLSGDDRNNNNKNHQRRKTYATSALLASSRAAGGGFAANSMAKKIRKRFPYTSRVALARLLMRDHYVSSTTTPHTAAAPYHSSSKQHYHRAFVSLNSSNSNNKISQTLPVPPPQYRADYLTALELLVQALAQKDRRPIQEDERRGNDASSSSAPAAEAATSNYLKAGAALNGIGVLVYNRRVSMRDLADALRENGKISLSSDDEPPTEKEEEKEDQHQQQVRASLRMAHQLFNLSARAGDGNGVYNFALWHLHHPLSVIVADSTSAAASPATSASSYDTLLEGALVVHSHLRDEFVSRQRIGKLFEEGQDDGDARVRKPWPRDHPIVTALMAEAESLGVAEAGVFLAENTYRHQKQKKKQRSGARMKRGMSGVFTSSPTRAEYDNERAQLVYTPSVANVLLESFLRRSNLLSRHRRQWAYALSKAAIRAADLPRTPNEDPFLSLDDYELADDSFQIDLAHFADLYSLLYFVANSVFEFVKRTAIGVWEVVFGRDDASSAQANRGRSGNTATWLLQEGLPAVQEGEEERRYPQHEKNQDQVEPVGSVPSLSSSFLRLFPSRWDYFHRIAMLLAQVNETLARHRSTTSSEATAATTPLPSEITVSAHNEGDSHQLASLFSAASSSVIGFAIVELAQVAALDHILPESHHALFTLLAGHDGRGYQFLQSCLENSNGALTSQQEQAQRHCAHRYKFLRSAMIRDQVGDDNHFGHRDDGDHDDGLRFVAERRRVYEDWIGSLSRDFASFHSIAKQFDLRTNHVDVLPLSAQVHAHVDEGLLYVQALGYERLGDLFFDDALREGNDFKRPNGGAMLQQPVHADPYASQIDAFNTTISNHYGALVPTALFVFFCRIVYPPVVMMNVFAFAWAHILAPLLCNVPPLRALIISPLPPEPRDTYGNSNYIVVAKPLVFYSGRQLTRRAVQAYVACAVRGRAECTMKLGCLIERRHATYQEVTRQIAADPRGGYLLGEIQSSLIPEVVVDEDEGDDADDGEHPAPPHPRRINSRDWKNLQQQQQQDDTHLSVWSSLYNFLFRTISEGGGGGLTIDAARQVALTKTPKGQLFLRHAQQFYRHVIALTQTPAWASRAHHGGQSLGITKLLGQKRSMLVYASLMDWVTDWKVMCGVRATTVKEEEEAE